MNDEDPVIKEIEETDRWLWKEGGETVDGFFDLCHRLAEQARAEYAKYGDAWRGLGREPDWTKVRTGTDRPNSDGEGGAWAHSEAAGEAMVVSEGEAPNYQTVERSNGQTIKRSNGDSDLARKGAEGDAR